MKDKRYCEIDADAHSAMILLAKAKALLDIASERERELKDKCYMVYWDGDCKRDYFSCCAVIARLSQEADSLIEDVVKAHNALKLIIDQLERK